MNPLSSFLPIVRPEEKGPVVVIGDDDVLGVDRLHVDFVHSLQLGGDVEAIRTRWPGTRQTFVSRPVVALDDETGVRVDHVEFAVIAIGLELAFLGSVS